jgi:hypothetical protein
MPIHLQHKGNLLGVTRPQVALWAADLSIVCYGLEPLRQQQLDRLEHKPSEADSKLSFKKPMPLIVT